MSLYTGQGVPLNLKGNPTNVVEIQAGQAIPLTFNNQGGWYYVRNGGYSVVQQLDPVTGLWRKAGAGATAGGIEYLFVDPGNNYRLANMTGCAVAALLTSGGSGYTGVPTVVSSGGSSLWKAIVGGAVNTTVTVTNGGSGYTYPPLVLFAAPPAGGLQATGYCTLSAGAVSTVTVTDQGAGYASAPPVSFINDLRETNNPGSGVTTGSGASAITTLTGSQTVTAVVCTDFGNPVTTLPTLTFSGGGGSSAAATVLMCWSITGYTVVTAGAGLAGTFVQITAEDALPLTTPAYTNPSSQGGWIGKRNANIKAPISATGVAAIGTTGQIYDGGIYTSAPIPLVIPTASVVTTAPVVTVAVGGQNDVCYIQSL